EDRPDVFPERVGLLPVVGQRAEDPEPVEGSTTRGCARAALPHRRPPPSSIPRTRLHIEPDTFRDNRSDGRCSDTRGTAEREPLHPAIDATWLAGARQEGTA